MKDVSGSVTISIKDYEVLIDLARKYSKLKDIVKESITKESWDCEEKTMTSEPIEFLLNDCLQRYCLSNFEKMPIKIKEFEYKIPKERTLERI